IGTTMMISALANSVWGECRSAKRAMRSKRSRAALSIICQPTRSCVDQPVALAADGAQIAREGRVGLDLAAQARDLHVDGALVDGRTDALAQRLAAQHLPQPRGEHAQQRGLRVGERCALALVRELSQLLVELEGTERDDALRLARGVGGRAVALQHVLDAQQELARLEGLAEIVVDAGLQAGDAILGVAHRS